MQYPYKPNTLLIIACLWLAACQEKQSVMETPLVKPPVKVAAAAPQPPALPDSICIAAVGDMMLGTSYPDSTTLPPDSAVNSFKPALDDLKSADITFGNLEGTLLNNGKPADFKLHLKSKAYLFRMPESYGGILKNAGFDVLSVANNHIGDFGLKGRESTTRVLDSMQIAYAGLQTTPSAIFKVKGVKYGFCAFAPNANTVSIRDLNGAAKIIWALKQECDVVIVSFHGGAEGSAVEHIPFKEESHFSERRGDVYAFAHNAIDAGADLVFGHGPHVARAMELYKGRLVAYSLGNFLTYRSVNVEGVCGLAPLLKVNVNRKGEFLNARIHSYRQSRPAGLRLDTLHRAARRIKWLTETDLPKSALKISDIGEVVAVAN